MPYLPQDFTPEGQTYTIYGKTVYSNFPMPLPQANGKAADITILFDGIIAKTEDCPPNPEGRIWRRERNQKVLRFYNFNGYMNQFLFRLDGSFIRVTQSWPEWRDTRFVLMNPVLAAAISLKDGPVMHASSLVHNGKSTLVIGISGAGKSTLSAALAVSGLSLHSDDIAVTVCSEKQPLLVMPGYPRIKISKNLAKWLDLPDITLMQVFTDPADVPVIKNMHEQQLKFPEPEKWLSADDLPGGFYSGAAPLNAIVILGERISSLTRPRIDKLSAAPAAMALTEHIYGRDWLNPPGSKSLALCIKLAQSAPVYRVNMPDDLANLLPSAKMIKDHIINGDRP